MAMALVFGATGAWADEITATLVHTASSYSGGTAGAFTSTIDAENEHINNSNFGATWAGAAYAEFSFEIPAGHAIQSATLTFTGVGEKRNTRNTDVMYAEATATLDYEALAEGNANVNLTATKLSSVTFPKGEGATQEFTVDATDAIKAMLEAGKNGVIFKLTNNPGGGDMKGKGSDAAPTLVINTISASAQTSYTVKFTDAAGKELKEAVKYDVLIGNEATASATDMASFFNEDKTMKYIYVSGNETITAVENAESNVITLVFREAEKYNYILKSNLGATLKEGADWEGETLNVAYPRYLAQDGTLYSAGKGSAGWYLKTIILNQDNQEETVDYTAGESGVVFLAEAEDIETLTESTAANSNIRCSNGLCAYNAGEGDAVITTLPNGKYKLYTSVWGNADTEFIFKAGDTPICSIETVGSIKDGNSDEFELNAASTPITLGATANAARGIDFVYIVKTGDAELEALAPAVGVMDFNKMDLPTSTSSSTDGDIEEDKTLTADEFSVTISPKASGNTNNRFWSSKNGGPQLRIYTGTLTVKAAAGKTLTKVVFATDTWGTMTANVGTLDSKTWTGEATEVVFTVTKQCQINSITVGETPAEPLADAANIAAFKALEKGTKAKLTVNGAKVTFVNGVNTYIEDETGALLLYNAGLNLTAGKALTGYINGAYTEYKGLAELTAIDETAASEFTEADTEVAATVVTVAEANAAESVSKLVKLEEVDIDAEGKLIKQGEAEINFYDKFKVMGDFVYPEYAKSIVGIITTADGVNSFCPVSPDEVVAGEKVEVVHTWNFTKWSEATVANLKAEAAKGYTEGLWSDAEKADNSATTKDLSPNNCFWQVGHSAAEGETLTANGEEIAELKGLLFTNDKDRSLAIAVNYGDCTSANGAGFGPYHGGSYLWLGSKGVNYFIIPAVKVGSTIKMGVESHNITNARGVELYVEGEKIEGPAAPKTYEEQEWTVTGTTDAVDVVVKNTNGCHIYFIDAEQDQEVLTGINAVKTETENGNIYNLQGQKVQKAQKGLYIINGKKVVIK